MSEIFNNTAPGKIIAWGVVALTGITIAGGARTYIGPKVRAVAQEVQYDLKDALLPKDGCQQINYDTLRDTATKLRDGLNQPKHPENYGKLDQMRVGLLIKHGLTVQNAKAIRQQMDGASGTEAMGLLDEFTVSRFGFETKTPPDADPKNFADDASSLINRLQHAPNELFDAADIDVVYLSDPEPATVKVDDGVAAAFTNPKPGTNEKRIIHIGPKQTDSLWHEFGHQVQRVYSEEECNNRPLDNFPAFEATNPKGFTYQFPAKNWEGVTFRDYGARRIEEDVPDTIGALLDPITERCQAAEQSPVLINKLSIGSIMLDTLKPNLGAYYLDNFITYCNTTKQLQLN